MSGRTCGLPTHPPTAAGLGADGPPRSDDGFVLIAIIGVMMILALIATSLLLASRTQIKLRAASATQAELAATADGVARLAAVRAAQPEAAAGASAMPLDGTPMWCRDGRTVVRFEINDVAGLIDLNLAPVEVLEILLAGLGVVRDDARALAAAIIDFRDADEITGPGGAESREYAAAGRSHGPKNAAFESVEELDQVLGMSPPLLDRLRPLVTVHNKSPAIEIAVAPLPLLQALMLGNPARGVLFDERLPTDRSQFQIPRQLMTRTNPRAVSRSRRRTFVIRVSAMRRPEAAFRRQAVIEVVPQAETGLRVHEWNAPAVTSDRSAVPIDGLAPCFEPK